MIADGVLLNENLMMFWIPDDVVELCPVLLHAELDAVWWIMMIIIKIVIIISGMKVIFMVIMTNWEGSNRIVMVMNLLRDKDDHYGDECNDDGDDDDGNDDVGDGDDDDKNDDDDNLRGEGSHRASSQVLGNYCETW